MARTSNDTGRAFEYVVVKKLENMFNKGGDKLKLSGRAVASNSKDAIYFNGLPNQLKENLNSGANAFVKWINQKNWFDDETTVKIDRISDGAGVLGDPTDIEITIKSSKGTSVKRISVKHNHNALKHPRLPRLPEQCGIFDKSVRAKYNAEMDEIWKSFASRAKKLSPGATKFNELKALDKNFINEHLYKPLINIVCSFLEKNANKPENAEAFFRFLTGDFNFYTIKNEKDKLLIKHFNDLKKPRGFKTKYPYKSDTTFLLVFDNGWQLTFRLHTATTHYVKGGKLIQSTKFDVLCINLEDVIRIDKIKK